MLGAPVGHGVGDELGAVVEPYEPRWSSSFDGEAGESTDDVVGVDGVLDDDGEAFPGELADPVNTRRPTPLLSSSATARCPMTIATRAPIIVM